MAMFPEVQIRAQAELNSVIGQDRLPTFDDRGQLPYVEAVCKEVMRYHAVVPNGKLFPHNCATVSNATPILFRASSLHSA